MTKIACICEGGAERAIIDILLEHNCLIFNRDDLLEEEVLRARSAREFQRKYLNKSMDEQITVYRILDSKTEKFNITGPYKKKIDTVINVITAPEIEMLLIHAENCYDQYARQRLKPSEYMKQHFKTKDVKRYGFIKEYFKDVNKLLAAIEAHHAKVQPPDKQHTIYKVILKSNEGT